jgi:hypothetical protein
LLPGCLLALALLPGSLGTIRTTPPPQDFAEESASRKADSAFSSPVEARQRHLHGLGVEGWHKAGFRGKGIKVAILDSGFRGYRRQLGKALPAQVMVRSFRLDGNLEARNSQHGILCGEVVHALAPEAELLFANWEPRRPDKFLEAVAWARRQGARIISCSLIMPSWSDGEGGGPVHEALAHLLGNGTTRGDLLCFAAAGNTARRHWFGRFRANPKGFHQWQAGQEDNLLTPWGKERVSVELCCPVGAEYEMRVFDGKTSAEVARSKLRKGKDRGGAVVRFKPLAEHTYRVRLRLTKGKAGAFHCIALHSGLAWATARGSICFPADGSAVIAVGAVDKEGKRAGYSACGPNSQQPKPDLVARVPFPSCWRSRAFSGTSAAAPQAAGTAALLWSRYPTWTAAKIRKSLEKSARDLGPVGHDYETGYGLVRLPSP